MIVLPVPVKMAQHVLMESTATRALVQLVTVETAVRKVSWSIMCVIVNMKYR